MPTLEEDPIHSAQDTLITDPILQECLELSNKTRLLLHEMLAGIQQQQDLYQQHNQSQPQPQPSGEGEAVSTPPPHAVLDPEQLQIQRSKQQKLLNAYLAQLKLLHRNAFMSAREAKQTTADARQEVDRLHLQLQNLYYEQRHLRGEISACRDFPHKYTSLPLISESEFLSLHPEHANSTPHDLMIARLHNEKAVREDLERQRKELVAKKQNLIAQNKKRKEELASLDEQLKKFIESARPIQATFMKEY